MSQTIEDQRYCGSDLSLSGSGKLLLLKLEKKIKNRNENDYITPGKIAGLQNMLVKEKEVEEL